MTAFWQRGILRVLLVLGFAISGLTLSMSALGAGFNAAQGGMLFNTTFDSNIKYACASCHTNGTKTGYFNLPFNGALSRGIDDFHDRITSAGASDQMTKLSRGDAEDIYAFLIEKRANLNPKAIIVGPAEPTPYVAGVTLTFNGSTSTPANVTYQWAVTGPGAVTPAPGNASTQSFKFATDGPYTITLTVTSTELVQSVQTLDIIIAPAPPIEITATPVISSPPTNTSVDADTPITVDGTTSGPAGAITYQWAIDGVNVPGTAGTLSTLSFRSLVLGDHTVTLKVKPTSAGPEQSKSIVIKVVEKPIATISSPANNTSVEVDTPLPIDGASSTPANGVTFQWAVDGVDVAASAGTPSKLIFRSLAQGDHTVTLKVKSIATGTESSKSIVIKVIPKAAIVAKPIISSTPASVVVDTTLTISGSESMPKLGVTYQWKLQVIDPAGAEKLEGTAATQEVKFTTVGTYRITLTVRPSGGGDAVSASVEVIVSPTPLIPAPVYASSGFDALAHFSATTAGSQTRCPTIQNNGNAKLTLSLSAVAAASSSANFSSYFELGDNASCPATPRACNTSLPAGSPISGATELQAPADSACTLAIRFNPAKFGDAGGIGARSATLRVTHNAPAGTVAAYAIIGNVTPRPLPGIGLSTNPSPVNGRVFPPVFASQPVGAVSALWNDFQVLNSGDADGLDLTEVANSNAQEFSPTENCVSASPLARPGAGTEPKCIIGLRFTPKAIGERCTTITVRAAESSNGAQNLTICGTAVPAPAPAITLSSDTIDFGLRFISASYLPKDLVISNAAGATAFLQINAITLAGSGFALVPNGGTSQPPCVGASLAPGASCTLQVQFVPDPTRPGAAYSASLLVDTNDTTTPRRTVGLAGKAGTVATPPVLQFINTPAQIEFAGVVVAGQQSEQPLTITLRNTGPGKAAIDGIRMVGADASSFSASGCSASMEHEESCVISVRFVPGSGGVKRAQLEILSSTSVPPALVTVIGRGVGGSSAFLTASVASLPMGSVRVGAQSAPIEVRLASSGEGVVQVTALQADGPFTVQSKTCPGVPFTLPRGADCTVTVTFTPTDARTASAMLRISTDADARAVELPLSGTGEAGANFSSGGCSMASGDTLVDPTLWVLILLAIAALAYRRRARATPRHRP